MGGAGAGDSALRRLRRTFPFELIHAHNAVPAGDAVRRAGPRSLPLVVSVHGGDVLYTARPASGTGRASGGAGTGRRAAGARQQPGHRRAVARDTGRGETRVVHLGADLPAPTCTRRREGAPTLVTVGHLVAQAPCRCAARAGGARQRPGASLRDRRRRPRAGRAGRARRAPGGRRAGRVPRSAGPRTGGRAGAEGHAVRDALHRGGVRGGLHRGDGRRGSRDRMPRRAGARGDRRGGRWLRARAAR